MCLRCTSRCAGCDRTCRKVAILTSIGVRESRLNTLVRNLSLSDIHKLNEKCTVLYQHAAIQGSVTLLQESHPWELISYAMVASKLSQKRIGVYTVQQILGSPRMIFEDSIEICILSDFGRFIKGLLPTRNNYDSYNFLKLIQQNTCTFILLSSVLSPAELSYFHQHFPMDCKILGGVI